MRSLLAHGVDTLRNAESIDAMFHPVLALLSPGLERLHKMTLGVCAIDDRGGWLTNEALRKYGHGIALLHEDALSQLESRTSTAAEALQQKVASVRADPVLPLLVDLLDLYAREGRYFDVDVLAGRSQAVEPRGLWDKIEIAARSAPAVKLALADLNAVPLDKYDARNRAVDTAISAELEAIASSVERLWTAVAAAGETGALGALGRKYGAIIHPDQVH